MAKTKAASSFNSSLNSIAINNSTLTVQQMLAGVDPMATAAGSGNVASYGTSGKHVENLTCRLTEASSRTVTCNWTFNTSKNKYLEHYEITWKYYTPHNGQWNPTSNATTTSLFSTYVVPSNADKAKCVVKPIQKKKYKNKAIPKKDKWTSSASTSPYAYVGEQKNIPETPSKYEFEIKGNTATCKVENYKVDGTTITFQIIQDGKVPFASPTATVTYGYAATSVTITPGHSYYMKCMATKNGLSSGWSDWTSPLPTAPAQVTGVTAETLPITETDKTFRIKLTWDPTENVTDPQNDSYLVQYTKRPEYFDLSPSEVSEQTVSDAGQILYATIISPSEEGTWYFRVRGRNTNGDGPWSDPPVSASVGLPPDPPTTWSYTSSVKIGEPVIFNWTHNSADGSKQEAAEIYLTINTVVQPAITIVGTDKSYTLETTGMENDTSILWKVKTKGAHPDFSDYSVEREVKVYTPPTASVSVSSEIYDELPDPSEDSHIITKFPLHVIISTGPDSQKLISADFAIVAQESYTIADDNGMWTMINEGDYIYKRRIDNPEDNVLQFDLTPGDINLANDMPYRATIAAYMSSGLLGVGTYDFDVNLGDDLFFEPDAAINFDYTTYTATIDPFCTDKYGARVRSGAKLNVFRINYDGTLTELASGMPLSSLETVTDPHPTLDYARYRIVAESDDTGQIAYYDAPPEPVNLDFIVMQWADEWAVINEDGTGFIGDTLILPYNVDVSDSNNMDVALIEYIGREHPVSYYGTQKGYTSQWKCDVRKDDTETIYKLRRLMRFGGDVYVREPNGAGYWANVKVQYSINHNTTTIPVSFTVTRVEGGA